MSQHDRLIRWSRKLIVGTGTGTDHDSNLGNYAAIEFRRIAGI